jgi:hypothetical protein
MQLAEPPIPTVPALDVIDIPPVLAVNPASDPGKHGRQQCIHRTEISGMQNIRLQSPEHFEETPECPWIVSGMLVDVDYFDVGPANSSREIGAAVDTNYRVPEFVGRQAVDQIDETIFQPTGVKAIDDVCDERRTAGVRW